MSRLKLVWIPNILSGLPVTPILSIVGQVVCLVRVGNCLGCSWSKEPDYWTTLSQGLIGALLHFVLGLLLGIK